MRADCASTRHRFSSRPRRMTSITAAESRITTSAEMMAVSIGWPLQNPPMTKSEAPASTNTPSATSARTRRSGLKFRREQVADRQGAIGPPGLRQGEDFGFGRTVIQPVDALDGSAQSEIAGEEDVRAIESHDQEAVRRPGPDPGHLGQGLDDLFVRHSDQGVVAEPAVNEPFRQSPQRGAFASRHSA